jgi:micrococcal nuclease
MSKRSYKRRAKGNPVVAFAFIVIAIVSVLVSRGVDKKVPPSHDSAGETAARPERIVVERAVDGDTLKLADGRRVRLIGIDTPEIHESAKLYRDSKRTGRDAKTIQAMGKRSFLYTKSLVEGKPVRLEFDVERTDKYGRLLAYVYLDDGTFVNAQIVREGYASPMTYPPNVKHADEFSRLYREAREGKKGLWE